MRPDNSFIIQPIGGRQAQAHAQRSLVKRIDFMHGPHASFLTCQEKEQLIRRFPDGKAHFWGNRDGKRDYNLKNGRVARIREHDVALFVRRKRYEQMATVTYVFRNKQFADSLWGVDEDTAQSFENLMALCPPRGNTTFTYAQFNDAIGASTTKVWWGVKRIPETNAQNAFAVFFAREN